MLEHGAYGLLLDELYATGKPLPADPKRLFFIAKTTTKKEKKAVAFVLSQFFVLTPSGYVNSRFEKELTIAESRMEKASKAAKSRWVVDAPSIATSNAKTPLEHMLQPTSPSPTPVPTPTKVNPKSRARNACAFPSEFTLTPPLLAFALEQGVKNPEREFEMFKDHHLAKGTLFKDWNAAWRTWSRRVRGFEPRGDRNGKPAESFAERNIRIAQEELGEVRRRARRVLSEMEQGISEPANRGSGPRGLFGSPVRPKPGAN